MEPSYNPNPHSELNPAKKRRRYVPIIRKYWYSQLIAIMWLIFSIWVSLPWVKSLGSIVGTAMSLFIIAGLAYIPGYLNAFLLSSLLFDKQPPLKVVHPKIPVTILIAARNEEKGIGDTLAYIAKQDYQGEIHVLIIDNGSTDDTTRIALEKGKELGLNLKCHYEERPGKNYALNTGLRKVKTDLFITLDADTLLHPSSVRFIVARYLSSPDSVCAVAGSMLVRNSRASFWTRIQEWDYFLGIASIKRFQGLYQGTLVAQGAFSLYKTEVVKEVGGWPDAIGEDIVLTWRFLKNGWDVYFEPLAVAFTEAPETLRHYVRQRNRWARGMFEALKEIKPWQQPGLYPKHLTGINLIMPYLDIVYTFCWLPGLVLAFFGIYWIVGPLTLLVLPLTLLSNAILFVYQRQVFKALRLGIRKNFSGYVAYVLVNQMIMSPASVWGYFQEIFRLKRVWK